MTEIHARPIVHPGVWKNSGPDAKDRITVRLTQDHLAAIDTLLAATRHLAPQSVTRAEFSHIALDPLLDELFILLQRGRGVVLVAGLDPSKYSAEELERVYWGFGTHWGVAAVQSARGERLGHVLDDPDNRTDRGYRSTRELAFHTDSYELVGLLSLQRGESGGESRLVSALAIHNEILATRPDLLTPLYRGFPYASNEARGTERPVTDYDVPIFSCVDGQVSCGYLRNFIRQAAEILGRELPADLVEAMDCLDAIANDSAFHINFTIEPGEMLLCNNFITLHARTAFQNSPTRQRHLLRLWLDVPNGRPVVPELARRSREYRAREQGRLVHGAA